MPEIHSASKFWLRGGKMSQKRPIEMAAEAKQQVVKCTGFKKEHPCKNPVFRCKKCGNYGCSQIVPDKCSRQGFKNDICLVCGTRDNRVPVTEQELEQYQNYWQEKES